ncbi:MAG TPA: pectinesterase family protein, partial [Tepidisphaeraceae bacterium]|nr:pectinesterase family protein [Tepidisphaeraceae bacterium]
GTRQYFKNCSISGSVDFIYGAATGIFDTCTITQRVGGVSLTAPATPVGNYGLVFINSHLVNGGAITAKTSALARAWNAPYGQSVFVHTNMDNMISDAGWTNFSTTPQYTATERYDEYDSSGAGAAGYLAVPTKRAAQAVNMTAAQAAVFADITTWTPNFTTLFGGWNPNQAWAMIPATFTAASGAWETGGNWDVGQAPVAGQAAYAPSGSITVSAADSCDSLTLGTTAGGATLSVNAGASLRLGGALNTNSNGSPISKVTVSGAFTVGTVILGNSGDELHLTNNATFNLLSGWGGAWAAGKLYVDNATLAAMNLGGKFAGPDLYLAAASGQSGTWNIQPGNTYYLHAIRTGAGTSTITMTGGTVYGAYGPSFGYAGGGGAVTFNMKGGEFDVFNPNLGAGAGTYVFNQTGGTFQKDMNTFATSTGYDWLLGDASGANATWNLSQADGSAIVNIRDLFVGQKGTGKFAQTAGAVTINQEDATQVASHSGMRLGWGAGGNGTYEISGGSLSIANGGITNGYDPASGSWGTGTFRVLGGAAGTINVTGNYSQSSHSLLDDHVNASGLSTMSITGNVSFASGAAVNLSADAGAAPGTYTLMSWTGSATGTPVLAAGVDTSRWSIAMGAHALTATLLPLSSVAGTSGNDAIRLVRNSSSLDIYINNPTTPAYSVPFASLGALSVNSLGGNDSITVDFGGGASPVPSGGLSIDGGANSDVLIIAGTTGADTATVNATTVIFNNSPITYANVESISINGTSGNDVLTQTAQPGNSATLSFSGSGAKTLNLNGGSFALNSDASAATPNLTVNVNAGGSVTFATTQHLTALNITGGGIASMSAAASPASPAVLNVTTLGISGAGSKLDLADNEMWTTATVANVWAMIQGGQIASSSTGGALGYAGQASGVVEVRYTLIGDANLDGVVDVGDLGALASSYGMSGGATWAQGDFNGNGAVDVGDLGALATKYGSNVSSLPATAAATFAMSSTNDAFAIDEPVRKLIDDITT